MKLVRKIEIGTISLMLAASLVGCSNNIKADKQINTDDSTNMIEGSTENIEDEAEINRVLVVKQSNAGVKRSNEQAYYYVPLHPLNDIPSMNVIRDNTDEEKSRYYRALSNYTYALDLQETIYIIEPFYSIESNKAPETLEYTAKVLSESALEDIDNFVKASDLQLTYGEKSTINEYNTMKFTGTFKNTLDTGIYEGYLTGYCFIYNDVPYGIVSVIGTGWKYPNANNDMIKEANDIVDACIQTVQVSDKITDMAREGYKSDGVFHNLKKLLK